jgi:hypothetical protein
MADRPVTKPSIIGSYTNPKEKNTPIEDKRTQDNTPAKTLVEGVTSEMEKDVAEGKDTIEKSKNYRDILIENDIPSVKAASIVDDLLCKGYYEEEIPLTNSTFVTFRTRSHSDYRRYLRALEITNPRYADEQQEIMTRYFIAASLVSFKGKIFDHPEAKVGDPSVEAAFEQRLAWIEKQPEPLVTLLAVKLHKFDRTVQVVMSEGVVENF